MKAGLLFVLIVSIVYVVYFVYRNSIQEGFLEAKCMDYVDCKTCAEKSDCTWCTSSKRCLTNSEIRGTDTMCNQVNLIHTAPLCPAPTNKKAQDSTFPHMMDDKTRPPNVYTTPDSEYTNETVMAQTEQLKKELANLKLSLPGLMAQTVHEQMKPMMKGVTCDPAPFR